MNEEQNIQTAPGSETPVPQQAPGILAAENGPERNNEDLQETGNMEVHHHPELPHKGETKNFKEYFLEFLMIFLAVTMGFVAENLREYFSERSKEKEYMTSLVADLGQDSANISVVTRQLFKNIKGQDSLIIFLSNYQNNDSINKKCYAYYFSYTVSVPQVVFNDRTMSQLLSSGNMRLISKSSISDTIMYYNAMLKRVKMQDDYYTEQFKKTFDFSANLFDFSIVHDPLNEDFTFKGTTDFNSLHFKMLSGDPLIIKKYLTSLTMLQATTGSYILDLRQAGIFAARLKKLLQKEYQLSNE